MKTPQQRNLHNLRLSRINTLIEKLEEWENRPTIGFIWRFDKFYIEVREGNEDYEDNRRELGLPEGYCGCVGCALGMAMTIWPEELDLNKFLVVGSEKMLRHKAVTWFGMDEDTIIRTFYRPCTYGCDFRSDVTAGQVAKRLRHLVMTHEIPRELPSDA